MGEVGSTTSPSAFQYQKSSPLDTLVRRTSSRRAAVPTPLQLSALPKNQQTSYNTPPPQQRRPPASPLLHTHFRASTATTFTTDNSSYLDTSWPPNASGDASYDFYDDASVYSRSAPTLRESWQSNETYRPADAYSVVQQQPYMSQLPSVVISEPQNDSVPSSYGRALIAGPTVANFSRPARLGLGSEEQKRLVLDRNSRHHSSSQRPSHMQPTRPLFSGNTSHESPSSSYGPDFTEHSTPTHSPVSANLGVVSNYNHLRSPPPTFQNIGADPVPPLLTGLSSPQGYSDGYRRSPPSTIRYPIQASFTPDVEEYVPPQSSAPKPTKFQESVVLPRRPPSLRDNTPTSVYSLYSFYDLDNPVHSRSSSRSTSRSRTERFTTDVPPQRLHGLTSPRGPSSRSQSPIPSTDPHSQTPQDYLQLGIQHHEANRLRDSALCFEMSAKERGGCGVGMLMWGLTLRHGWGCEKNEKSGFKWLRKAAEIAVADLESTRGGMEANAVQSELILAIYEVGQCFFQGWGVPKDRKMAVSYYRVAAKLGDVDAQSDLAFCLANGKGCKKDRKEAAKWYRAAVDQGLSNVGLAWIYKEKFK